MKVVVFCLLFLLACSYGQRRYDNRNRQPQYQRSVGMTYQAPPPNDGDQFIEGFIGMFLQEMRDTHIDRYEVEDGVLTNIDIHIDPPATKDITFRANPNDGSFLFRLHGVSIKVDSDLDMYFGLVKGHAKIKIDKIDVDLDMIPLHTAPFETYNIKYHLHMKDSDIQADIHAVEDESRMPAEIQGNFMPMMGNFQANFKVAASEMIDENFEKRTKEVVNEYMKSMSSEYVIPKKVDHEQMGHIVINARALPFIVNEKNSVVIDFDTHTDMVKTSKQGVKDLLMHSTQKSSGILAGENELESTRSLLNDNKHHILIAPHLVSGLLTTFDNKAMSFKLEDQAKLQNKVHDYFGNDIELECLKHENEYPEYHTKDDAIVGEQTVKCALHPKGFKFDPLYEIDLKLTFNIHPELDKDGKSLKASFGDIQATQISVHDKKMEVATTVYDKADKPAMMAFNPFLQELDFPFNFDPEMFGFKIGESDRENLMKFKDIFESNDLIDRPSLESTLLPKPFRLPLPPGMKFAPSSGVKIHPNGVIDVNGDMTRE